VCVSVGDDVAPRAGSGESTSRSCERRVGGFGGGPRPRTPSGNAPFCEIRYVPVYDRQWWPVSDGRATQREDTPDKSEDAR